VFGSLGTLAPEGHCKFVFSLYIPQMRPLDDIDLAGIPADHRIVVAMSGGSIRR